MYVLTTHNLTYTIDKVTTTCPGVPSTADTFKINQLPAVTVDVENDVVLVPPVRDIIGGLLNIEVVDPMFP